jgi:isopentenyl diphosphate isomerase/L-lactate dehydrogenase-like FMN-dependent dehydrogenase
VCIGGGYVAVKMYLDYVKDDLRRDMLLTGCDTVKDANMNILDKLGICDSIFKDVLYS